MNRYFIQALEYGANSTAAIRLNTFGQVAGGVFGYDVPGSVLPILWDGQIPIAMKPLQHDLEATGRSIKGMNDEADVLVAGSFTSCLWRNGKWATIPELDRKAVSVSDINNHGHVTGDAWFGTGTQDYADFHNWTAFVCDTKNGGPKTLLYGPDGLRLHGIAINNKGHVLCTDRGLANRVFLAADGAVAELFSAHEVTGINEQDWICGTADSESGPFKTAFLYRVVGGVLQKRDIGALSSRAHRASRAFALNKHGVVVGVSSQDFAYTSDRRAFVCSADGEMQDLNDLLVPKNSGWVLTDANDINDEGKIVGTGFFNNLQRGFLLTPVKVPQDVDPADPAYQQIELLSKIYALVSGSSGVWFGPGTRPGPIDPDGIRPTRLSSEYLALAAVVMQMVSAKQGRGRDELEIEVVRLVRRLLEQILERH